jgi:hypothetical protein
VDYSLPLAIIHRFSVEQRKWVTPEPFPKCIAGQHAGSPFCFIHRVCVDGMSHFLDLSSKEGTGRGGKRSRKRRERVGEGTGRDGMVGRIKKRIPTALFRTAPLNEMTNDKEVYTKILNACKKAS